MTGKKLLAVSLLLLSASGSIPQVRALESKPPVKVIKPAPFKTVAHNNESERGKALFSKYQCSTCHTIGGGGGCLAPPLDGVGARRSKKFMISRIVAGGEDRFSELYGKSELMPHMRIPAADAGAVVQYLLTIPQPKIGFKVIGHNDTKSGAQKAVAKTSGDVSLDADSITRGRQLLTSKGCLACHSLGNLGGTFAEKLDSVGSRLTKDLIKQQMQKAELLTLNGDGEYGTRGTVMPPLNLSEKEIEDISSYLSSLK
jgi:mono/diheme cytochrome c family protein